jgi:methylmalonyl-CoA mutase C-terminal domain/subunit
VGLDGHDRGVKIVARWLRDAGMEVIYTGLHHTPEQAVEAAAQEDVDVLGISVLSGAHMSIFPRVIEALRRYEELGICLVAGGVIPDEDVAPLREMGVRAILGQNSTPGDIVTTIRRLTDEKEAQHAARS